MRKSLSSIKAKVFALVVALSVGLVGFMTLYFPARQIAVLQETLESKASAYARLTSEEVTSGIAFEDRQTIREVFASMMADRDVRALALYASDGRLLYLAGDFFGVDVPPPIRVAGIRVEASEHYVRAFAPVVSKEGPTGTLILELDTERVHAQTIEIRRVAASVGAAGLACGILAAWAIGTSLAGRLRAIVRATQAVANGDLTANSRPDPSADEVGQLSRAFTVMQASIAILVEQIRKVSERERERLDVFVQERTSELSASVERYRTLVEGTHAIPWEMDARTLTLSYISPQVTRTLGVEPISFIQGRALWESVHPDDRAFMREQLEELGRSEAAKDLELDVRATAATGETVYFHSIVHTSGGGAGATLRGISFDVTRQKRLEVELSQAQKLESVGRLAAGVAHEINTPVQFVSDSIHFVRDATKDLAGLIGQYQAVCRAIGAEESAVALVDAVAEAEREVDLPYLLENLPPAVERSLEGLERVAVIVRSMKEFAHPDQKDMTPVDLNRAIESTLTIARTEYKYVADVETQFQPLPLVSCHAGDVNQAVLNIIVNAAHAIGDKVRGTRNRGLITVRTRLDGASVVIAISDTGGGIPENIRNNVFDPFFTTKAVGKGTGQGLAIARSVICDKHGGQLTFETEVGRGTTFELRFPVNGRTSPLATLAA